MSDEVTSHFVPTLYFDGEDEIKGGRGRGRGRQTEGKRERETEKRETFRSRRLKVGCANT